MDKLATGIHGLDTVLDGGIPRGSLALVAGPPGAGKTVLCTQIAFHHAAQGKKVLILTALSEAHAKLIAFLGGLKYFDADLIGPQVQLLNMQKMITDEGLDAALSEIRSTVVEDKIEILIIESYRSLYALTGDMTALQNFVFGLGSALFLVGCTTLLVGEQPPQGIGTAPEQAIADTILMLTSARGVGSGARYLEVTKLRGGAPLPGKHTFEIGPMGIQVFPRVESVNGSAQHTEPGEVVSWGLPDLDTRTDGGVHRNSTTLLLGTVGIGKSTFALQFCAEGVSRGEPVAFLSTHEPPARVLFKADAFGLNLRQGMKDGTFQIMYVPPDETLPDKVLLGLLEAVDARTVRRVVIDGIEPLERMMAPDGRFADVLASLVQLLRSRQVTAILTRELSQLVGPVLELSDDRNAYWTPLDNILLMRPVEIEGTLERVFSILKMRDSRHSEELFRFDIGPNGIRIGGAVQGLQGLLTGLPRKAN